MPHQTKNLMTPSASSDLIKAVPTSPCDPLIRIFTSQLLFVVAECLVTYKRSFNLECFLSIVPISENVALPGLDLIIQPLSKSKRRLSVRPQVIVSLSLRLILNTNRTGFIKCKFTASLRPEVRIND